MQDNDYSRENLIAICDAAIVPEEFWDNPRTPQTQKMVGILWAQLRAGCEFTVHVEAVDEFDCFVSDDQTIWLDVESIELKMHEKHLDKKHKRIELFYLPTPKRLRECSGRDWCYHLVLVL